MFSLIKNKQYSKLSYKLGFYSAMLGFIEWFYWIIGLFINPGGWNIIITFFIIASIIAIFSAILGLLAIGIGIYALKNVEDKKLAIKGIIYGALGMCLLIALYFKFINKNIV